MGFQKPEKFAEGVRFLLWGEFATGKSPSALSFPKQALIDADSGTSFHSYDNVLTKTNTLIFKELNEDLDELEDDDELFNQIQTFNVDSITRFAENQEHAALKVVEQRARKAGRLIEGEGLSFKERGVIKLHYDRFFAKMLNYVKLGKNLVFIAENKDKNETRIDSNGNQTFVKVGEMPNMQKKAEFDFDVVIYCYLDNGEPMGRVIRDKTNTFNPGDIIEKPNYSHWKEAIEKKQSGKKRTKAELDNFEDAIDKEAKHFASLDEDGTDLETIIKQIMDTIKERRSAGVDPKLIKKALNGINPKEITDVKVAKGVLDELKKL